MFRANIYKTRAEAQPQQIRKIIWKNGRTVVVYVIKHNWRSLLRCQARKCSSPTLMSVPFHKSGGSLRPIAVVDPMYRICAKAVLKATLGSKFILPFPWGFGRRAESSKLLVQFERMQVSLDVYHMRLSSLTHLTHIMASTASTGWKRRLW